MMPFSPIPHASKGCSEKRPPAFAGAGSGKALESAGVRRTFYVRRNDEERSATQHTGFLRSSQ